MITRQGHIVNYVNGQQIVGRMRDGGSPLSGVRHENRRAALPPRRTAVPSSSQRQPAGSQGACEGQKFERERCKVLAKVENLK